MAKYILVSGAWHGGWCWERVVPLLEAQGHDVLAPDLLSMGQDRAAPSDVTLARWAEQIAALAAAQDKPCILVGHSRGGIIISEVAERVPQHVRLLVYLTAALVPSGETMMAVLSKREVPQEQLDILITNDEHGLTTIPRRDAAASQFYNLTPPAWTKRALSKLGPEPMISFATPLKLTAKRYGSVARCYVECTEDNVLPLSLQRDMQRVLPCGIVRTLHADHSPFYSCPDALAQCLLELAGANTLSRNDNYGDAGSNDL